MNRHGFVPSAKRHNSCKFNIAPEWSSEWISCKLPAEDDIHVQPEPQVEFSAWELAAIRTAILTVLDDGTKSDTEEERFGFLGEGYRPWKFYAENWREDTEDSTSDRTRFCDAVQSLLTKKAQT